jgi:hypothetical protein
MHKLPVTDNRQYINTEDGTVWMLCWEEPGAWGDEEHVIMLDEDDDVIVVPTHIFKSVFILDDGRNYQLELG